MEALRAEVKELRQKGQVGQEDSERRQEVLRLLDLEKKALDKEVEGLEAQLQASTLANEAQELQSQARVSALEKGVGLLRAQIQDALDIPGPDLRGSRLPVESARLPRECPSCPPHSVHLESWCRAGPRL